MGADFSKFQGVIRCVLQILVADNIKGFKAQLTASDGTHPPPPQKKRERIECIGATMCSVASAAFKFQERTYNSISATIQ
jgi:hypothetical protein